MRLLLYKTPFNIPNTLVFLYLDWYEHEIGHFPPLSFSNERGKQIKRNKESRMSLLSLIFFFCPLSRSFFFK